MFNAEHYRATPPSPEAESIDPQTVRLETAVKHHRFPDLPETSTTLHSDLFKDFSHYLFLLKHRGRDQARLETKKMLSGNFLSIAKEMKGMQWMQTAFKIKKEARKTLFQRSEFKGGDDLRTYSLNVHETIQNPAERERFLKENLQMVGLFDRLEALIANLDWSDSPEEIIEQLTNLPDGNHFEETTLPVTKELLILYPALQKHAGHNLRVYVTKPLVTVSPTSSVHLKRQTSLAWVNRLVYIPDIHELVFLRDGIFSGYGDEEIAEFLTLDEEWAQEHAEEENVKAADYFQTEDELFAFIAALPEEYRQVHAHTILNEIIRKLGGFKPAPKINNVTDELSIDVEELAEAVLDIFEWELLTYGQDTEAALHIAERLNYLKDIFLHHLATNTAIDWQQSVSHYQTFFEARDKATRPEEHVKEAQEQYSTFYPKLAYLKIDLSVLDCGVGSVVGGFRSISLNELRAHLGVEGMNLLRRYDRQPIRTQSELIEFCRQFNKDYRRFDHQGECKSCHHFTFLGECDICPVCEVKDDLGITSLKTLEVNENNLSGTDRVRNGQYESDGSTTLGLVVASIATKQVLDDQFWWSAA